MFVDSSDIVIAPFAPELEISDLNHSEWLGSQPVFITHQWSGAEAPPERQAEVRLCWNNEGLFVRFIGQQHEPMVVADQPVTNQKTVGLWDRDVCEIFLAPDVKNSHRYFEFQAAPTGEWIDLALEITASGRQTEWDFASGMRTTSITGDTQIVIGILIPWSDRIPKAAAGTEWRVNLFRCIGTDEATRYLTWRPTKTPEPNFHVPEAFGILRFA